MKYLNYLMVGTFALALSACGGDSGSSAPPAPTYSGITTPVAITSTNAPVLSTKATDATEEAITQQTASDSNPFGISATTANSDINPLITRITREVVNQTQANINLPAGATITLTDPPFCGGSISYPDNMGSGGTLNGTITYNNLCYDDGGLYGQITINGTVTFTETVSTITIRYINFRITGTGLSETVNMTVSCDTSFFSCSISADFTGSDGKVYRIADMSVSGSGTGPYYINATFYHPDYGSVILSSTGLYYACSNGYPSAGTISITGSGTSSASITFNSDCTGYTGTWDDGISTGTFSGTWL
ncbi:MAG: hypothetical protein HYZ31_11995 [Gammaproteobacteria bacterium]|nr:hypothetical protein [Gammaproteobacteria bacterium]